MKISELKGLYGKVSHDEILKVYGEIAVNATHSRHSDDTLLHIACSMADAAGVDLLLQRGLNPNTGNRYGQKPLHALAALDDRYTAFPSNAIRQCADLLFEAGAKVVRRDEDLGQTPITLAGKQGRFELLESAVSHGVKITGTDRDGNNALHLVCQYVRYPLSSLESARSDEEKENANRLIRQFYQSAQALLAGGIDADEKNDINQTALEIAVESRANSIALLLQGRNTEDETGAEAQTGGMDLFQAVIKNDLNAIRANVVLDADINSPADTGDFKGMTPLAIACYTLELPTVKLLLELGANSNTKDAEGRTAIAKWFEHLGDFYLTMGKAIENIPGKILQSLLATGMNKDEPINDTGDTPLLGACKIAGSGRAYNNYRMANTLVAALIAAQCNPDKTNLDGVTPLMLLCAKPGEGISNLAIDLFDSGADVNAVDKNGNTVLHYAAQNPAANAGKELAELVFDYGFAHIDAVNNAGKSALEIAVENNNEPLVKLILQNSEKGNQNSGQ